MQSGATAKMNATKRATNQPISRGVSRRGKEEVEKKAGEIAHQRDAGR